jgi:sugar phosphate isomerase/epimerase
MAKIPVALQLYSVREDCGRAFLKTLQSVAKMGYDGVEFAGYYGRNAKELKSILDDLGLKVAGTHVNIDSLISDELDSIIEFNKILDNHFLIVPGLPEKYRSSKSTWIGTAQIFNEISEKIRSEGMFIGYHNHDIEFHPIDGEIPFNIFFDETNHDVVIQLDTGHAMRAGADPIEIIRSYPGRFLTLHIKDFSSTNEKALIGEGEMKWQELLNLCETIGNTQWYIIEQETYPYPPIKSVKMCLENFNKI